MVGAHALGGEETLGSQDRLGGTSNTCARLLASPSVPTIARHPAASVPTHSTTARPASLPPTPCNRDQDIMIAAMLKGVARVHHHDGFRSAWQGCGSGTVLKHLDNDAPLLQVRPLMALMAPPPPCACLAAVGGALSAAGAGAGGGPRGWAPPAAPLARAAPAAPPVVLLVCRRGCMCRS